MTITKYCPKCREKKDINRFGYRNRSGPERQSYCLECMSDYRSEYYRKQLEAAKETQKKAERFKSIFACSECGITDIRVLGWKEEVDYSKPWEEVFDKLTHADLLCANCMIIQGG